MRKFLATIDNHLSAVAYAIASHFLKWASAAPYLPASPSPQYLYHPGRFTVEVSEASSAYPSLQLFAHLIAVSQRGVAVEPLLSAPVFEPSLGLASLASPAVPQPPLSSIPPVFPYAAASKAYLVPSEPVPPLLPSLSVLKAHVQPKSSMVRRK